MLPGGCAVVVQHWSRKAQHYIEAAFASSTVGILFKLFLGDLEVF